MHEIILNSILLKEFYNSLSEIDKGLVEYAIKEAEHKWQLCPKCNGSARTLADGFTSNVYAPCDLCLGQMIISSKNGLPPSHFKIEYRKRSKDDLKIGDSIKCLSLIGHVQHLFTEGKIYKIIDMWTEEGRGNTRFFINDNKERKRGYNFTNFYRRWEII